MGGKFWGDNESRGGEGVSVCLSGGCSVGFVRLHEEVSWERGREERRRRVKKRENG